MTAEVVTMEADDPRSAEERVEAMRQRQDGDYSPPILAEPVGGPIPQWQPADTEQINDAERP